jgi:hypothetical protein
MKIINFTKRYFKRFSKPEFIIICLLSVFVFPLIRPSIIWFCYFFLSKNIGEILWDEYIYYVLASIVCFVVFGLVTAILSDFCSWVKKFFRKKETIYSDLEFKKSDGIFSFYILDLESWAKKNNLHNKVPENLWEKLRVAKSNLDFRFVSYNRISFKYLLKRYRKINQFMVINTKIFKLLRNDKSESIIIKFIRKIGNSFISFINKRNK